MQVSYMIRGSGKRAGCAKDPTTKLIMNKVKLRITEKLELSQCELGRVNLVIDFERDAMGDTLYHKNED